MSTERDTHFQGFAKLLWQDLLNANRGLLEDRTGIDADNDSSLYPEFERVIAQRAYDLAVHVFNHTTEAMTLFDSFAVLAELNEIPDLTEWPQET